MAEFQSLLGTEVDGAEIDEVLTQMGYRSAFNEC